MVVDVLVNHRISDAFIKPVSYDDEDDDIEDDDAEDGDEPDVDPWDDEEDDDEDYKFDPDEEE